MIPKKLHLIWFNEDGTNPLSKENRLALPDFASKLKYFEVYVWLNGNIMLDEYNSLSFHDFDFSMFKSNVSKSDAFRLYVVHRFGGVYADWDFDFTKPIDDLLNCHAFVGREDETKICNAIFGAEEGSPFIKAQLDRLHEMPKDNRVWGVKLMTDTVMQNPNFPVTIYPQEYFYPYPWDERDPAKMIPKGNTYLSHRWAKTWWK